MNDINTIRGSTNKRNDCGFWEQMNAIEEVKAKAALIQKREDKYCMDGLITM